MREKKRRVGGGTHLDRQSSCLDLIGVKGSHTEVFRGRGREEGGGERRERERMQKK